MFSIRNVGGVALFLFGTTFLWLTPSFASRSVSTDGVLWSITNVGSLATVAGFTVATWGLFQRSSWWELAAITSAVVGLLVLAPYWLAASSAGEVTPGFTAAIHAVGSIGVLLLLLVPPLESWVSGHVIAGR